MSFDSRSDRLKRKDKDVCFWTLANRRPNVFGIKLIQSFLNRHQLDFAKSSSEPLPYGLKILADGINPVLE